MKIQRFEDLQCWQLARRLTNRVYDVWEALPKGADFVLRWQMVAASGSCMHNIAERFDADTKPEFVRFLRMAKRSFTEVQSQLYLSVDRGYIGRDDFAEMYELARLGRAKTWALIKSLRAQIASSNTSASPTAIVTS